MAIIKNVTSNLVVIDKTVLEDPKLSIEAKGVYCMICANNGVLEENYIHAHAIPQCIMGYVEELYKRGYLLLEDE